MDPESLGSGLPAGVAAHPPFVLKSDSPPYACYSLPLPLIGCTGSRCILTILFLYVSQLVSLVSLDFSCFPPFPLLRSRSSREFWPRGYNAVASKRPAPARRAPTPSSCSTLTKPLPHPDVVLPARILRTLGGPPLRLVYAILTQSSVAPAATYKLATRIPHTAPPASEKAGQSP